VLAAGLLPALIGMHAYSESLPWFAWLACSRPRSPQIPGSREVAGPLHALAALADNLHLDLCCTVAVLRRSLGMDDEDHCLRSIENPTVAWPWLVCGVGGKEFTAQALKGSAMFNLESHGSIPRLTTFFHDRGSSGGNEGMSS